MQVPVKAKAIKVPFSFLPLSVTNYDSFVPDIDVKNKLKNVSKFFVTLEADLPLPPKSTGV